MVDNPCFEYPSCDYNNHKVDVHYYFYYLKSFGLLFAQYSHQFIVV
jgi:hypothetical protein